jgi:hypothetical protein
LRGKPLAAQKLSEDKIVRVLEVLSAIARANPEVQKRQGGGRGDSLQSMATAALTEDGDGEFETIRSQFRIVRLRHPERWAEAMAGKYVKPDALPGKALSATPRRTRRYLLTAAQDDTPVHMPFWQNLLAFSEHIDAEIMVGGFTYQKALYEDHVTRTAAFAAAVGPYLRHDDVDLGPLIFFGRMNILPTAVKPLSGLETHARGKFGVFPHAKLQLVSVPSLTAKGGAAHQMTTGACTMPNYIEKKAGQKAEFHHVIGACLVEVDVAGRVFCRQISAADDGSFQDLDCRVRAGAATTGHRIEAISFGDIHREKLDPLVAMALWGLDLERDAVVSTTGMYDALKPRHVFLHDLLDFEARNHHRRNDHHFLFRMIAGGTDKVEAAINACAGFIRHLDRDWCTTVVVPSNHHDAYERWLKETDPRLDPINALFWFRSNTAVYEAIEAEDRAFDVFRWALARADTKNMDDIVFPPRGGSYVICQDTGGIECAIHGDQGVNGTRGSPLNLSRVATRMNTGHTHSPSIIDGVYTAGLCGLMDQGYNNESLSSWSQSQILVYPNGKRSIVTLVDGLWRAA